MMERKPEWLRVRYNQDAVNEVAELMRELNLNTVCREANCRISANAIASIRRHS